MRPPLLGMFIPSKTDSVRVETLEASLDLRQLRYFVAVAELENVGRAATVLNISQSPLSRQIQQLEAQLGLDLFERERKRLRLTAEGRQFLDEARDLLAHAERLEMHSKLLGRGVEGRTLRSPVEEAQSNARQAGSQDCLPRLLEQLPPDQHVTPRSSPLVGEADSAEGRA